MPIPCIEYFVIKAFLDKSYPEVKVVLESRDYRKVSMNYRNRKLRVTDLEKYCKSVVENYKSCYGDAGIFYTKECKCSTKLELPDCVEMSLLEKSWKLVTSLPAFKNNNSNTYVETKTVDLNDVVDRAIRRYYEVANKYLELGIIAEVHSL